MDNKAIDYFMSNTKRTTISIYIKKITQNKTIIQTERGQKIVELIDNIMYTYPTKYTFQFITWGIKNNYTIKERNTI